MEERKESPEKGWQTPSAFVAANWSREGRPYCLPSLTSEAKLLQVTKPTEVGFILHPVTLQQKRTSSTSLPAGQKQKPRRATGGIPPSSLRLGGRGTGQAHPVGFSRLGIQGRDQASPLGLSWAPGCQYHPQKHSPGDSEAHKAALLGGSQTDYKFTGDNQGI